MKHNRPFLNHILEEINFITGEMKGLEYKNLTGDEILKRAFLRSLEIIGEASKQLSQNFIEKHPEIEWRELTGLRDILIHRYFGVQWNTVWSILKDKIPPLKSKIETILKELEENDV